MRKKRVQRPQRRCKETFVIGEKVLLQDTVSKKWSISAEVTDVRLAPDNQILSYELKTENDKLTTRHRAYMNKLPKIILTRLSCFNVKTNCFILKKLLVRLD